MQLFSIMFAVLLAAQPIFSTPVAYPEPAPTETPNVLKKDQIKYPYCMNSICALYCEYKGRPDTGFQLLCPDKNPLLTSCKRSCKEAESPGFVLHYPDLSERLKLKAASTGFGQTCLKGWRWTGQAITSCTDTSSSHFH